MFYILFDRSFFAQTPAAYRHSIGKSVLNNPQFGKKLRRAVFLILLLGP